MKEIPDIAVIDMPQLIKMQSKSIDLNVPFKKNILKLDKNSVRVRDMYLRNLQASLVRDDYIHEKNKYKNLTARLADQYKSRVSKSKEFKKHSNYLNYLDKRDTDR